MKNDYFKEFNERYMAAQPDLTFEESLPEDKSLSFKAVREGVYYVDKKPIYIIDLMDEYVDPYVLVFAVQDDSDVENPTKKWKTETIMPPAFLHTTELSRLANEQTHRNKLTSRKVNVINPPLFMSPVIEGVDTFTQEESQGFNEKSPDKETSDGLPTGVFITLATVRWTRTFIPQKYLVDYFQRRKINYLNDIVKGYQGDQNGF